MFDEFSPVSTADWLAKIEKELKGKSADTLTWVPEDGISLKPFYRKQDLSKIATQPPKPNNQWLIQEDIEMGMGVTFAKQTNQQLTEALIAGVTAPNFLLDEVMSDKDFSQLLKGVHPQMIYLNFSGLLTESHPFEIAKLTYNEFKQKKNSISKSKGAFDVDPIGFYIEEGAFYEDEELDFQRLAKATKFIAERLPNFTTITVKSHLIHQQDSTLARELAISIAIAAEYVVRLKERGIEPEMTNKHLKFSLSVGSSYFMEMGKIRALKILWPKVMEGFGVQNAPMPFIHAQTAFRTLVEDENANRIKVTTQAMCAAIAGVDSLTVLPADALEGESFEFSRRIARNVQHLMSAESYLGRVYDPAAGSYYIEQVTNQLVKNAWEKFLKIEDAGGIFGIIQ